MPVATNMRRNSSTSPNAGTPSSHDKDTKRRKCISTACIACRKRKSKCDGAQPACAACVSVYHTECIYDPSSDHRRKGVYKKGNDHHKIRNSTLQTLIQAILNFPEEDVPHLVTQIRACESLDEVADAINTNMKPMDADKASGIKYEGTMSDLAESPTFESRLASRVGQLKLEQGTIRMLGGTSNLLFSEDDPGIQPRLTRGDIDQNPKDAITSWTTVTSDRSLITHLLNHYFTWHYPIFPLLPKESFYRQFYRGMPLANAGSTRDFQFCTSLLVNAMAALGCHFTSVMGAWEKSQDPTTAGDHFFQEAKRQLYEQDELATPSLATIQALTLMSLREAGCGRESRGWVFSGMAFRMVCDLGLNFYTRTLTSSTELHLGPNDEIEDARRITFWGCFIADKCWSQYLGRLPMFQLSNNTTTPKFEVLAAADAEDWVPYYDSGFGNTNPQSSQTRAVALRISTLCEVSGDIIRCFYHPQLIENPFSKTMEMNHLNRIHSRLEKWEREIPREFEAKKGALSSVLIMHMMFQLLHIHLFRPFLKHNESTSPLPSHMSPRRYCTQAAVAISKLFRLYKTSYGLRQIVNIAVYICHSACTIHLLNLPEKIATQDLTHGIKHLDEIAEGRICARRTLLALKTQAQKWNVVLPDGTARILSRALSRYGNREVNRSSDLLSERQDETAPDQFNEPYMNYDNRVLQQPYDLPFQPVEITGTGMTAAGTHFDLPPAAPAFAPALHNPPPNPPAPSSNVIPFSSANGSSYISHGKTNSNYSKNSVQEPNIDRATSAREHPTYRNLGSRKRKEADMFGGVEALLREGRDWVVNDQSSLASGFSNWTSDSGTSQELR